MSPDDARGEALHLPQNDMVTTDHQKPVRRRRFPGARALVVEARYYEEIADELLAGATGALSNGGLDVTVLTVDGALELPVMVAIALDAAKESGRPFDVAIALGCVIRGETGHYDIVAGESARALMDLSVSLRFPIGNGILTVETMEQALARARVAEMNKGGGAAEAALAVLSAMHLPQEGGHG